MIKMMRPLDPSSSSAS